MITWVEPSITPLSYKQATRLLHKTEYRWAKMRWSAKVMKRDGYKCQFPQCQHIHIRVTAHHVAKQVDYPELVFDTANGLTLCTKHHSWVHANEMLAIEMGLLRDGSSCRPIVRRVIETLEQAIEFAQE